jgi:penicillin amidase
VSFRPFNQEKETLDSMKTSRLRQTLSLTFGATVGLVGLGTLVALRRPLPQTTGTLRLPKLQDNVQILRDEWSIPHIYATSNQDLFTALGFVHAQDRLWQMELNRRTGHGQLAELFGSLALDTDRFIRILGFNRIVEQEVALLDAETHSIVDAYTRGVNHFIETHSNRLPIEYTLLRHQPRPWTAADCLIWSKIIALNLSSSWPNKILNAHMHKLVGQQQANELDMRYPAHHPMTIPPDSHNQGWMHHNHTPHSSSPSIPFLPTGNHEQGSNAWVVSGNRSASGAPMLANDPHLLLTLPSLWYEVHLEGGDYAVTGVSFPGIPCIIIGHNTHIAWGITNAMTDVQDLYIERFNPEHPDQYLWQNEHKTVQTIREAITIRGKPEPFIEEVRLTHHGPIITPALDGTLKHTPAEHPSPTTENTPHPRWNEELALRWTALEPGHLMRSLLNINRASNWQEFRSALEDWNIPPQNFVYADSAGHIGYTLAGNIPIRRTNSGKQPVPGWNGAYEWQGYIPASRLPATFDPPQGYIVTANNRIAEETRDPHYPFNGNWFNGYRAARIEELIKQTPLHTIESFAHIQHDLLSLPGLELAQVMQTVPLSTELEQQARDLLTAWDGHLTAESVGGTIYTVLRYHLERYTYASLEPLRTMKTGMGAFCTLPYMSQLGRRALPGILERIARATQQPDPDSRQPQTDTWTPLLQKSMATTVQELQNRLGKNPHTWQYGRIHRLTLQHPLGKIPLLANLFNRGPIPTGGDIDTICMGYAPRDTANGPIYVGPSYRQICNTGNWDASCSMITGGQSGHPASRHYSDMISLWRAGRYHPMLWSRPLVESHTITTLTLTPDKV